MIRPVTYQGVCNFKSNLYALEVKSRFIDQSKADGYYKGYGDELAATVINNSIQVSTGAFVIQGRMSVIETAESVNVTIENGKEGYVCLRSETYHPSDEENCSLVVYTASSLGNIVLTQEDTYVNGAETSNKVYELPIYSFTMENGNITNLNKLIKPIADYATVKALADKAVATAQNALNIANSASDVANTALSKSTTAESNSSTALSKSTTAESNSQNALNKAAEALEISKDKQGTVVSVGGVAQTDFDADRKVDKKQTNKNYNMGTDANGNVVAQNFVVLGGDLKLSKEVDTSTGEVSFVIEFPEEA